jgi:hypothetical protein
MKSTRNFWKNALLAGAIMIPVLFLTGCKTAPKSRVNLFADSDYRMTVAGDVVAGMVTRTNGIWFSKPAIDRLLDAGMLRD